MKEGEVGHEKDHGHACEKTIAWAMLHRLK